jgi:hypothetical protein
MFGPNKIQISNVCGKSGNTENSRNTEKVKVIG